MKRLTQSYMTGEGSGQLLYETIGRCFNRVADHNPDTLALVVRHQDVRWTYREFRDQVDRLATGLIALGIEPGDRVGIWGPNSYEWVLTQFATAKIGAIMVCINPAYRLYELEFVLNKVQCKAIIQGANIPCTASGRTPSAHRKGPASAHRVSRSTKTAST